MTDGGHTVDALFDGKESIVRDIYDRLCTTLDALGTYREEPKKTSIHLVRNVGFAGVHPRKAALILNLRTEHPIDSPRVVKREQVSKNRWHNEVKLASADEVDAELTYWLQAAYALG